MKNFRSQSRGVRYWIAVITIVMVALPLLEQFSPVTRAVSIPATGIAITQNFDSLANTGTANTWTDNSTLPGWYSQFALPAPTPPDPTVYIADAGTNTTGAIHSYGAVAGTERAFGSICSNGTGAIYNALKLTNDTGSTITSLYIKYTGEQWRNGGNATPQQLDFQYQIAAAGTITDANTPSTGWTDFDALDFVGPIATATAGSLDGNAAANRSAKAATVTLSAANGQEIWLRWRDNNDTGNDHGLAIDDVSVTPLGGAFSTDGITTTDIENVESGTTTDDAAYAVAVQPLDGKIIVGGYAIDPVNGDKEFALARYTYYGALDSTFGSNGIVTTDFHGGNDRINGIVIQTDGKIVAAGTASTDSSSTSTNVAVARYNTNGTVDTSTDTDLGANDTGNAVALLSDGRIVVAATYAAGASQAAVVRYTTALVFDGGTLFSPTAGNNNAQSVAISPTDQIYLAGFGDDGTNFPDFILMRLDGTLNLDATFGTGGTVITDLFTGSWDEAYDVAMSGTNIVVAGLTSNAGGDKDFAVVRYTSTGAYDVSFDTDAIARTDLGGSSPDVGRSVAVQTDGKIVVSGFSVHSGMEDFALVRYNTNGSLDTGFSGDGKQLTSVASSNDRGNAVAIQSDGKIVAAGFSTIPASSPVNRNFAVVRYAADGSLDAATGSAPTMPVNLALTMTDSSNTVVAGSNFTYTLAVQNNGPGSATGVVLTDTLPAGVTYVSETHTNGTVSGTTTVTNTIGALAAGQTATLTITVSESVPKLLTNTASVTCTETDTNPNNNSAVETTRVLGLNITIAPLVVAGGCENPTGTATLSGNAPAGGVTVTLSSNDPSATPDAGVFIAAGTQSANFAITTSAVVVSKTPTITGTLGTASFGRKMRVNPCLLE